MNPLFLICIFVRLSIAYLALLLGKDDPIYLKPLGLLTAFASFAFFISEFSGLMEYGFLGQKIWWFRYVHSLFYAIFSYLALKGNPNAYVALVLDVVYGLFHYIHNYTK